MSGKKLRRNVMAFLSACVLLIAMTVTALAGASADILETPEIISMSSVIQTDGQSYRNDLQWTQDETDIDGYKIYRRSVGSLDEWTEDDLYQTIDKSKTVFTENLPMGIYYEYAVCSYKKDLETENETVSEPSETVAGIPTPQLGEVTTEINSVKITWEAVEGIREYNVYRSSDNRTWTKIASMAAGTSYTDTKATAGRYYYKVTAVLGDEESAKQEKAVSAASKIAAPTLNSAAAKDYRTIVLSWSKVPGADGYYINCGGNTVTVSGGSTTSYTYKSATPTKAVAFKVQAFYKDGTKIIASSYSNTRSAATKLDAPAVKSASVVSSKKIKFSWNKVNGASGYEMFINGKSIGITTKNLSCTYQSSSKKVLLKWGKKFKINVRAYRVVNGKKYYSASSKTASVVMHPAAVGSVSAKGTAYNTVKVTWKKVSGASGYSIYRKEDSGKYKKVGSVSGSGTISYYDRKASVGRKYTYKVCAYWKSGSRVQNSVSTYAKKTVSTKLSTPKLSDPKMGRSSVTVRWKKVSGAQGYIVYRRSGKSSYKKVAAVRGGTRTSYRDDSVQMNKKYVYTVKAYRKSGAKTYKSAWNEKGEAAVLKIKSKVKTIKDRNSIMYGKKVRLYYYPDGTQVQDVSDLIGKVSEYQIYVNKTKNQITVYTKDKSVYVPVKSFICSVGLSITPTPSGTFYTKYHYRWQEMMGPSWGQWVTRITWDGILFHSVFYNSPYNNNTLSVSQYNRLGSAASHGCIRMTAGDAKWLYDNCKVGTKVVIYTKSGYEPLRKPTAYKLPSWHTWDPTDPNMYYKCRQRGCH